MLLRKHPAIFLTVVILKYTTFVTRDAQTHKAQRFRDGVTARPWAAHGPSGAFLVGSPLAKPDTAAVGSVPLRPSGRSTPAGSSGLPASGGRYFKPRGRATDGGGLPRVSVRREGDTCNFISKQRRDTDTRINLQIYFRTFVN